MAEGTDNEKPAHPPLQPGEAWRLIEGIGPATPEHTPQRIPQTHTEDSER